MDKNVNLVDKGRKPFINPPGGGTPLYHDKHEKKKKNAMNEENKYISKHIYIHYYRPNHAAVSRPVKHPVIQVCNGHRLYIRGNIAWSQITFWFGLLPFLTIDNMPTRQHLVDFF